MSGVVVDLAEVRQARVEAEIRALRAALGLMVAQRVAVGQEPLVRRLEVVR